MEKYLLKVKLLTDTVFGSGHSVPGFIDADVLHDQYGFPYINGKTLKGKLGEMATVFVNMIKSMTGCSELGATLEDKKDKLFGKAHVYNHDKLKFSDCEISEKVREYFKHNMQNSGIEPQEILEALTHIETQTSIDYNTGIARGNSLHNFRIVNRGIAIYSYIYASVELDEDERILLASACSLLRHIGSHETKGKGQVDVSLLVNDKEVTYDYIRLLEKKVNINV